MRLWRIAKADFSAPAARSVEMTVMWCRASEVSVISTGATALSSRSGEVCWLGDTCGLMHGGEDVGRLPVPAGIPGGDASLAVD